MLPPAWSLVVPVKTLPLAKTRLAVPEPGFRARLALALAVDTVSAALQCSDVGAVVVVTDDPQVAAESRALGAEAVPDVPADGLNAAIRYGERAALDLGAAGGVAALTADLPALRPRSLTAALAQVPAGERGFVPDSTGSGTTLLAAAPGVSLEPAYGPGSRRRHAGSGAVVLDVPARSGLRRDVDTVADLLAVETLGVGLRTAQVLVELRAAGVALAG